MESFAEDAHELLGKISHFNWVLQFYGFFDDCMKLCMSLSKKTRALWFENYSQLYIILLSKKTVKIHGEFDQQIADYLLENKNYSRYKLVIDIKQKTDLSIFLSFLDSVD
jgi:hypothetical protein